MTNAFSTVFAPRLASLVFLCAVLWLAGCSAGKSMPEQVKGLPAAAPTSTSTTEAHSGFDSLPSPASLERFTAAAPTDYDRLRQGPDWEVALPHNKVFDETYSPEYAGAAGRTLSDAAYAMYSFSNLDEYSGPAQVQLGWKASGDAPQDVYLGLANFAKNRWDLYKLPASWKATLPGFASYVNTSATTIAAVISLDNGDFLLDYVLAGTNTLPVVSVSTSLDPNPLLNVAPLTVSFDATASRSFGGTITGFDFDWEGDGTWDVTGNTDGLGIHQFAAGNYDTKVRATDNLGQTVTATTSFAAIDPSNQVPTASFTRTPTSGDAPLTVQFDASGSSDPDGYIVKYEWDFDSNGSWDFTSDTPQASSVFGIAGSYPVTLRVTDNFYGVNTTSHDVTINKGWHTNFVDASGESRYRLAVCTTGTGADARACVAYQEFKLSELHFSRAKNAEASSWSAFVKPVVSAHQTGYSPSMDVITVGGAPLIAYGEYTLNSPLYVVSATDYTGASWNSPVLVDGTSGIGLNSTMKVINTVPCIAALDGSLNPGLGKVLFFTAKDGQGSDWNVPTEALSPAAGIKYASLALGNSSSGLFKRPIIACGISDNLTADRTVIVAATNPDGSDWNSPQFFDNWTYRGRLTDVDGLPAFCGGSAGAPDQQAYFIRATDGYGTAWPQQMTEIGSNGISADLQVVDGKPFIVYQDGRAKKLYALAATDADGSNWEQPYVIAKDVGDFATLLSMTLVNGQPIICYAYTANFITSIRSVSFY